jgi:hypothetical protein
MPASDVDDALTSMVFSERVDGEEEQDGEDEISHAAVSQMPLNFEIPLRLKRASRVPFSFPHDRLLTCGWGENDPEGLFHRQAA